MAATIESPSSIRPEEWSYEDSEDTRCSMTRASGEVRSVYFKQASSQSREVESSYFQSSPSSTRGCTESLGSWLEAMAGITIRNDSCSLNNLLYAAKKQFESCPFFLNKWNKAKDGSLPEDRMKESVRHLCSHNCFMRAHAPYREWLQLHEKIREKSLVSSTSLMEGWRCYLLPLSSDNLPRVVFEGPDGKVFKSQTQVLERLLLGKQERPLKRRREDGYKSTGRRRMLFPSKHGSQEQLRILSAETPLGFLEELFVEDAWKLLISTIFLNRTSRVQVDAVLYRFFQLWSTPGQVTAKHTDVGEIIEIIRPMGICYRRADGIIKFSKDYLRLLKRKAGQLNISEEEASKKLSRDDILGLYHCGVYAADAYQLFIQRLYEKVEPADRALRAYVLYQRAATNGRSS